MIGTSGLCRKNPQVAKSMGSLGDLTCQATDCVESFLLSYEKETP